MKTVNNLFEECVNKYSNNVFLLEKQYNHYKGMTYKEVHTKVLQFAAGLIKLGIKKGDRIALLSEGNNYWVIAELGIFFCGAVNVPLSIRLSEPGEIKFRIEHSGCIFIIASSNQSKKITSLKKELPQLQKIIILDSVKNYDPDEININDVINLGKEFLKTNILEVVERKNSIKENDYANICYTSGTTSDPKGIILTHRNYTANIEQSLSLFSVPDWWTTLIILPWDHAFAHTCGIYTLMSCGASMASVHIGNTPIETLKNIPINIRETSPSFLLSVPALAKNFKKNIEKGINDKGFLISKLFIFALKIAFLYNGNGWNRGKGFKIFLKPFNWFFNKILFSKIKKNFGGKLEFFIGGGALLDLDLQKFFYAIGMPMFQGYGLTEASPVISANNITKHKMGSSGTIANNITLKICNEEGEDMPLGEKGEIVIKGENVMAGYWNNIESTEQTIKNSWLYTGDMGYLDKDGFLYVSGRFKSLLIADDGEKYSPEGMEEAFVSHSKFIEQCMLYNNQKAYTVLLIYPNKVELNKWSKEHHLDSKSKTSQEALLKKIESELNEYRKGGRYSELFPQRWLPASTGILFEEFNEENQMMNSTLKLVRAKITTYYSGLIDFLYTPEAKNICNSKNLDALSKLFQVNNNN